MKFSFKKLIWGALFIGLGILMIIGVIRFGSLIAFLWIYSWTVDELELTLGLNHYLANLVALVPAIAMAYGIVRLFSTNQARRNVGIAVTAGCYLLYCLLLVLLSGQSYFNPQTGEPTKCYSTGLNGYEEISCAWKFHPQSGSRVIKDPAQEKSIILSMQTKVATRGRIERVAPDKEMRFFSPDGAPLYWYYQHPDGTIEIFAAPGKHPQLNVELNPLTPEIVKQILYPESKAAAEKIKVMESTTAADQSAPPADPSNPLVKLRDHLKKVQGQLR
jgi:hypothetical protein